VFTGINLSGKSLIVPVHQERSVTSPIWMVQSVSYDQFHRGFLNVSQNSHILSATLNIGFLFLNPKHVLLKCTYGWVLCIFCLNSQEIRNSGIRISYLPVSLLCKSLLNCYSTSWTECSKCSPPIYMSVLMVMNVLYAYIMGTKEFTSISNCITLIKTHRGIYRFQSYYHPFLRDSIGNTIICITLEKRIFTFHLYWWEWCNTVFSLATNWLL